jgi:hypothetical protein
LCKQFSKKIKERERGREKERKEGKKDIFLAF